MYLRMLLTMGVSLYTSRVVLRVLGQDDFGTYSIVAGFVVMFSFISTAMSTATQRHLSFELGKADGDISYTFVSCFRIHFCLSLVMLLLAETIGLWFLNTKMNFPEGRMMVVNCLYQCSIISCMIGIVQVPFQASIVANEKLSYYAYLGIAEAVLKLGIVYLLGLFTWDSLLVYGCLMSTVTLIIFIFCSTYSLHILPPVNFRLSIDRKTYYEMLSFSGWTLFGSFANVGYQQGVNVIINLFFGVGLNAAVGISNQVNSALTQFVSGFQQALNPQLVRSEAEKDRNRQQELIFISSKLSFIIITLVSFPVLINLDYILNLWLGEYPMHTKTICQLILLCSIFEALSGPLWVSIFATGRIKVYQMVISLVLLLNLPLSYIGGRMGMEPEGMYMIRLSVLLLAYSTRLIFLHRYIELSIYKYVRVVVFPVFGVVVMLVTLFLIINYYDWVANDMIELFTYTIALILIELIIIVGLFLSPAERGMIQGIIVKKCHLKKP